MLAHDAGFLCVQRAGFEQDAFRHGDFSHVVKPASDAKFPDVLVLEVHASSKLLGVGEKQF